MQVDETVDLRTWLRHQRKALALTQEALAELADCSSQTIQKIEAGKMRPSADLIQRLRICLAPADTPTGLGADGERETFPVWLRKHRKARTWTQADLATKLTCHSVHIHHLEKGEKRPSPQLAEQIAVVFEIPEKDRPAFVAFARGAVALPLALPPTTPTRSSAKLLGILRRPAAVPAAPIPISNNLPLHLSRFIGREREIAIVTALLAQSRLVTLTGPGGVGKTRLAVAVGERVRSNYADGVVWIPLTNISSVDMLLPTMAANFGLKDVAGISVHAMLATWLQNRDLLVILDNFEQVAAAAPLLLDLMEAAPQLTLLVTSRTTLQLSGEQEYPVPVMTVPALDTTDLATLAASEAVTLFAARAREVRPDFELTADLAPIVAAICARLDGLPLAIELAAARVKLLPPATLLTRLNESPLNLLVGGARNLPARQQTLRAAIAWSYDLLDGAEQALFRRLAVFTGSWSLESAEAVCEVAGVSALDGLESLLNKSLITQLDRPAPRFTMLTMIRDYAGEQLIAQGEDVIIRSAHLHYYHHLVLAAVPQLQGATQKVWFDRFEQEHDNLRSALTWAEQHEPGVLLDLAATLWPFWQERGYWSEGQRWVCQALAVSDISQQMRAHLLLGGGTLARLQGDTQQAHNYLNTSLDLYRAMGDQRGQSACLYELADLARTAEEKEVSARLGAESLTLARAVGDQLGIAKVLLFCMDESADEDEAAARYQEALALSQAQHYLPGIAMATYRLGGIPEGRGDLEQATALYLESLALFRDLGDQRRIATVTEVLGEVAHVAGDLVQAQSYFEPALALWRAIGHPPGVMSASYNLAKLARDLGQWQIMCEYAAQGVQIGRAIGSVSGERDGLLLLGHAQLHLNQAPAALSTYLDALAVFEALAAKHGPPRPELLSLLYGGLAFACAATGRLLEAAHLLGATVAYGSLGEHDQEDYNESLTLVQTELEPALIETAQTTGSTWSLADVRAALRI